MTEESTATIPEQVAPSPDEMTERLNELQEANRKLSETNERILSESKQHAQKWREYRDAANQEEITKLEEEKNWKALMEKERAEKREIAANAEVLKRKTLKKTLDFEVARYASDANDVTDIINSLPANLIKIDEDTMAIEGVSDAVNALRETKPYLFRKATTPETVNGRPGSVTDSPGKSLSDLSIDDKLNALKDVLAERY